MNKKFWILFLILLVLVAGIGLWFVVFRFQPTQPEESRQEVGESIDDRIDSDQDGLTDREEAELGTSPTNPDTDGDGYSDGEEIAGGYDPLQGGGKLLADVSSPEQAEKPVPTPGSEPITVQAPIAPVQEPVIATPPEPQEEQLPSLPFVIVDKSETAFITYYNIISEESAAELKSQVLGKSYIDLVSLGQFKGQINQYVRIEKNEYTDVNTVQGLIALLEEFPEQPFGVTWNGGIAFTYNDYEHAKDMYDLYRQDPAQYEQEKPKDRASDPIHPLNHLGPLLGWQ